VAITPHVAAAGCDALAVTSITVTFPTHPRRRVTYRVGSAPDCLAR
jgi:hypothetical protein